MAESGSVIERIKQKLDIVEEIGAVVQLKKSGKAFKGLCPFHGERTPSFYVFPETGTWRCFGCNEGGDLFTFVEKQQGLDFPEALALLAERAGISLESGYGAGEPREEPAETGLRKRLRALDEAAAIWFHHQLLRSADAQYARSYLDSRGVNSESIALWRLGYAPEGDGLSVYLREQGYTDKELIEAGLAREREASRGGGLYDYFRNRLIFPIRDARGQTIAFGGRELGGGHPKYLNTPQTPLFDKSATLFGLDLARDAIRRGDRVVIVEGYMDAVVTHQYGFRNVVACIGSAITEKHVRQIKKLTRRVALALDPDEAGESATVRGITVAQEAFDRVAVPVPTALPGAARTRRGEPRGMVRFEEQVDAEITVVRLPAHEDPDEFVRRDTEGWRRAVEQAQPLIDFLIEAQTADLDLSNPRGKIEATRRLLPVIAEVRDRTLADEYVGRLAARVRLDKVNLARDLAQARQKLAREARAHPARGPQDEASSEDQTGVTVEPLGEKYPASGGEGPGPSYSASGAPSGAPAFTLLGKLTLEEYCLGLLLNHPELWGEIQGIVSEGEFEDTEARALFRAFADAVRNNPSLDVQRFLTAQPPVLGATARHAVEALPLGTPTEGPPLLKAARVAAFRLKRTRLEAELIEIDLLKEEASRNGDEDAIRSLFSTQKHLLSQMNAIDKASRLHG